MERRTPNTRGRERSFWPLAASARPLFPRRNQYNGDQMNSSSNASTERRNPMPKPFTTIVPPSFKAASETYQYAPAVRIGDQILISGIIGADAEGRLPPDFRSQAENVFSTLEAILKEAGAAVHDGASLHNLYVGDFKH